MSDPIIIDNNGTGELPQEVQKYSSMQLNFTSLYKNNITYSGENETERIIVVFEIEYRDEFSAIETLSANSYSEFYVTIYKKET